jgi:AhpD family alkylhydroperoxidase
MRAIRLGQSHAESPWATIPAGFVAIFAFSVATTGAQTVLETWRFELKPAGWVMATVKLLSDNELSPEAHVIFDDIRSTRQSDFVNNFWRALAHDPKTLGRIWESVKQVMAPGALEPKVKEMLYVAVSIAHGCTYCIHSHTASARAKGMTDQEYAEMIAIVGMAAETNRLVTALGVAVDDAFLVDPPKHGGENF